MGASLGSDSLPAAAALPLGPNLEREAVTAGLPRTAQRWASPLESKHCPMRSTIPSVDCYKRLWEWADEHRDDVILAETIRPRGMCEGYFKYSPDISPESISSSRTSVGRSDTSGGWLSCLSSAGSSAPF